MVEYGSVPPTGVCLPVSSSDTSEGRHMTEAITEALWAPRALPLPGPDAVTVGAWTPTTPFDLTLERLQLADALRDAPGAAGSEEGTERLLLAFEELASNALRHGRPPVRTAVT